MYDHRATDQKKSLKAEFEDLQKRFEEVTKVTSRHEETIRYLEYKLDMMGKQMIGAVSTCDVRAHCVYRRCYQRG